MSNCNRDLCRRHIPVVVNAIKKIDAKQESERPSYVATFSLTGEDASINGTINNKTKDASIAYIFPQKYAAIFNAASTDPNMLIYIRLVLIDDAGDKTSYNITANTSTKGVSPSWKQAGYYPDSRILTDIQNALQVEGATMTTVVTDALTNKSSLYGLYGTIPYIVTSGQYLSLQFYFVDDLMRAMKNDGFADYPDNPTTTELRDYLFSHVTLGAFEVSGIYTPSRLS